MRRNRQRLRYMYGAVSGLIHGQEITDHIFTFLRIRCNFCASDGTARAAVHRVRGLRPAMAPGLSCEYRRHAVRQIEGLR
jgi:hypothetical protein